jgi:hypothetical protein
LADAPYLSASQEGKSLQTNEEPGFRNLSDAPRGPKALEVPLGAPDIPEGEARADVKASTPDKDSYSSHGEGRTNAQPERDQHDQMEHRVGPADSPEAIEPLATFSSTAMDTKKFQIEVRAFEEKTGVDLGEKGKTLAISGEIEGVGKFRKIHTCGSKGEYFPIYPPKDRRDSIVAGDKYKVNVRSVEEVSRSADKLGTFYLTPILESRGSARFDLTTSSLEKRCGLRLEDGKIYDIKGKIGGYYFEMSHIVREDNRHIFIRVPKERAAEFKPGEKHEVTILSVTEHRALATVPRSEVRTKLLLQERTLASLGVDVEAMKKANESDRLLDVTLRKVAPEKEERVRRVFGKFEPQRGVLLLNIADAGGKQGDTYEVLKANKLTKEDFVREFNAHRRKKLDNTSLSLERDKLILTVDKRSFEAKSHTLDVNQLRAFMRAEFEPYKKEFSFWFDGETVFAKYSKEKAIDAFSTSPDGLEMTYPKRVRDFAAFQPVEIPEREAKDNLQILGTMKLVEGVREIEGPHLFQTDESIRSSIAARLQHAYAQGEMRGKLERGTIGEDIVAVVFPKLGWKETVRHPFSSGGTGGSSEKRGTDILFRSETTGESHLVEVKWWKSPEAAMKAGTKDLLRRKAAEQRDPTWGQIVDAYIAVIDYDLKNDTGVLHVKRVW